MKLQPRTQQRFATFAAVILSLAIARALYSARLFPVDGVLRPFLLIPALSAGVALMLTFLIPGLREADYKIVAQGLLGAYVAVEILGTILVFLIAHSFFVVYAVLGGVAMNVGQAIGLIIAVYAIRRIQRRRMPNA